MKNKFKLKMHYTRLTEIIEVGWAFYFKYVKLQKHLFDNLMQNSNKPPIYITKLMLLTQEFTMIFNLIRVKIKIYNYDNLND